MPFGNFQLSELNLDLENVRVGSRLEPQPDQRGAIRALIDDQKQKLVNLAIDVLDHGLSPGEPIWVTPDPNHRGKQIVLEGNRRVCALKIMENPRLADATEVATPFADLAKEFAKKPIRTLDAALFPDRKDAQHFIDLRHMRSVNGVSIEKWRSLAKERAQPGWSGRVRRSLLTLDYLDDGTDEFGDVGAVIEAKSTTVDRVLNNPAMKTVLGIDIDPKTGTVTFENGDELAGRRLLRDVITEMAKPDFQFSQVQGAPGREQFLGRFADRSVRAPGKTASPSAPSQPAFPTSSAASPRPAPLTAPPRSTLAPGGAKRIAKVEGDRLKQLYKECCSIPLKGNENAAALLLRVFLELSSEALLNEKDAPLPSKVAGRGLKDWSDQGIFLREKINAVLAIIDPTGKDKKLQRARTATDVNSHATGSITTLHGYFHNVHMTPTQSALREAWDTWENYLRLLHAARG